eukprot:5653464-Pleurochrysis_carterae.AAC.1
MRMGAQSTAARSLQTSTRKLVSMHTCRVMASKSRRKSPQKATPCERARNFHARKATDSSRNGRSRSGSQRRLVVARECMWALV